MNLSFATVLFAAIVASLIALPMPAPVQTQPAPAVLAKTDRLSTQPEKSSCSQQNWPNFDASCLHYTDDKQAIRGIRNAVGDQS